MDGCTLWSKGYSFGFNLGRRTFAIHWLLDLAPVYEYVAGEGYTKELGPEESQRVRREVSDECRRVCIANGC